MDASIFGVQSFNPVQEAAFATRFIENRSNLVVATPTGSGKTIVAMAAALDAIRRGKKVVYTCPLKALASEQHDTFKRLPVRCALSTGDMDSSDKWLEKYDLISTSYEKLDSLMRHKAPWIADVGLLIVDEIHLLDSDRGPTLEIVVTRFKYLFPRVQVIALSATIPNAGEIAKWLGAELVLMDWRPTHLAKGTYVDKTLRTTDGVIAVSSGRKTPVQQLVDRTLSREGSALVFCNSRRSAEAEAERQKPVALPHVDEKRLVVLADKVEHALEAPTRQCRRLADCVRGGSAFHHSGLVGRQRELVESAFRTGLLRVISATPTLAMGVNLPADAVIMASMKRYTERGSVDIPVREWLQCAGRAGRPQFGRDGLAVIVAKDAAEEEHYWETFVDTAAEDVHSQLGWEPVLRTQVLASVALGMTHSRERLREFLLHSFHAFQYGEIASLEAKIDTILEELVGMGFVVFSGSKLLPTQLGKRVSELYLDPVSAYKMVRALRADLSRMGYLFVLADTEELRPYFRVGRGEEESLWVSAYAEDGLGVSVESAAFEDYHFLEKYKTATLLRDWIEEKSEDGILDDFGVAPGILRAKLQNADWLVYCAEELCKLEGIKKFGDLSVVRRRLKYGCKEELIPLVELKHVGRVRARRLFANNLRTLHQLRDVPFSDLSRILGPKVAESVKAQLGQEVSAVNRVVAGVAPQTSLSDF
ncbi:MAG: DEAD/DEAH box helicase [Candidatus Diapherotrites archaeon]|nr:DEAD/DEAH box helicase [Candidatus Diapherotrites archaeon]